MWSWETFIDAFPFVIKGINVTIGLTFTSYALAIAAVFICLALESSPDCQSIYVTYWISMIIRSTQSIVQIFFLYIAWSMVPYIATSFTPFIAAMIALGVHLSTYIAEVYRSSIESVDKGQWE